MQQFPDDDQPELIHSYTRAEAINDGVLHDISEWAKEAGFRYPVAVTAALWGQWIEPDDEGRANGQSESGRAWDVLNVLRAAIKGSAGGSEVRFEVLFQQRGKLEKVALKSLCGPGDDAEPVITILMPDED